MPPTNITKYPNSFGELLMLQSPDYGTVNIPPDPVPVTPGDHGGYQPGELHKKDLWSRQFLMLLDVGNPDTFWGKSLKLVSKDIFASTEQLIEYGDPSKLETPRNFSISGDGTANPVSFDGSADVVLALTNVIATSLKTARAFSLTGDVTATAVNFDATGNVTLTTTYASIIPDNLMPSWISSVIISSINSHLSTLDGEISTNTTAISNLNTSLGTTNTNVSNLTTNLNTTNSNVTNLTTRVTNNETSITGLNSGLATTNSNVATNTNNIATLSEGGAKRWDIVINDNTPKTLVASDVNKLIINGAGTITIPAGIWVIGDVISIIGNGASFTINSDTVSLAYPDGGSSTSVTVNATTKLYQLIRTAASFGIIAVSSGAAL